VGWGYQDNPRSKVTVSALLLGAISCAVLEAALPLGAVAVSGLLLGVFGCVVLLEAVTLDAAVVVAIAC
jgi:membrane-bound ClpP family serine protease